MAQAGFSLIEMAVVLVIIGLILGGIFRGQSALVQGGRTHDAIQIATDLSGMMIEFKNQYHYLPGDFPVSSTAPEIPDLDANCMTGGANAGNGDGLIQDVESICVPEHLSRAGLIKGGTGSFTTAFGTVRVIANGLSNTAVAGNAVPARYRNVAEFAGLPCDVAMDIDRKLDDGNLGTGNVRGSVTTCTPDGAGDPVPFLAIGL